jgi:membrane complex biogenesis BtpA family protein
VHAETIASVAVIADRLRERTDLPLGINILRNDARAALAIAAVTGASFIRVNVHTGAMLTDQGWIEGRAHETLRLRASLNPNIVICADVMVKHALPPAGADLCQLAADTFERGRADVLIVSGKATGAATNPEDISTVKRAVPDAPVWIGSGLTPTNVHALLKLADGGIAGSAIKADGHARNAVDPRRAAELVRAARALPQ